MSATRVAIYTRVSTDLQKTDMQRGELEEYCKRRGWQHTEYSDKGFSGAKDRRPALDRLLDDARKRRIDVVLIYRLDRLARSTRHLVNLGYEFAQLGIQFVSLHDAIDTTTSHGTFFFHIMAAVAELERSLIVDRVRSGVALARSQGKHIGRPRLVNDELAASVRRLRGYGAHWSAIAKKLGVSRHTCRRAFLGQPGAQNPQNFAEVRTS